MGGSRVKSVDLRCEISTFVVLLVQRFSSVFCIESSFNHCGEEMEKTHKAFSGNLY